MKSVKESVRETQVVGEYDVCVLGGSCTGVFAAVRAARLGLKVAIVEQMGFFGGVATAALVNIWHSLHDMSFKEQIIGGLTHEVIERLKKRNAVIYKKNSRHASYQLNTEELKIELDELIQENQIRAFLHAKFCSPYIDQGQLKGLLIEDKSGRRCILAKMFIDASGDADLLHRMNQDLTYQRQVLQPPTFCFRLQGVERLQKQFPEINLSKIVFDKKYPEHLKNGFLWLANFPGSYDTKLVAGTRCHGVNVSDADQLSVAEIEGRKQVRQICDLIRNHFDAKETISISALATHIGGRESRHIKSMHQLTGDEVLYGVEFEDAIAYGTYPSDIHFDNNTGIELRYLDGKTILSKEGVHTESKWRDITGEPPAYYQIPFRSLITSSVPNIIAAGRNLDADAIAFGAVRVMVLCNQMGEAAGVASYLALQEKKPVYEINTEKLIRILNQGGSLLKQKASSII